MAADEPVVAEEMQVQTRHRDALIDAGHPEAHERAGAVDGHGLDLLRRHLGERPERRLLPPRDARLHAGDDSVEANDVEQIAAREPCVDRVADPVETISAGLTRIPRS